MTYSSIGVLTNVMTLLVDKHRKKNETHTHTHTLREEGEGRAASYLR